MVEGKSKMENDQTTTLLTFIGVITSHSAH